MPCSAGGGWRTDQKIIRTSRSAEDLLHHAEKSTDRVTARRSLILTAIHHTTRLDKIEGSL